MTDRTSGWRPKIAGKEDRGSLAGQLRLLEAKRAEVEALRRRGRRPDDGLANDLAGVLFVLRAALLADGLSTAERHGLKRREREARELLREARRSLARGPPAGTLPVAALLVLIGSPVLRLDLLALADRTVLPEDAESRRGAELLAERFPGGNATPVTVVLEYEDGSSLIPRRIDETYGLSRWIADRPGVDRVGSIVDLDPSLDREQYARLLSGPRRGFHRG